MSLFGLWTLDYLLCSSVFAAESHPMIWQFDLAIGPRLVLQDVLLQARTEMFKARALIPLRKPSPCFFIINCRHLSSSISMVRGGSYEWQPCWSL